VLFADLVGFTTLSEGRDPEQVKAMLDRCFAQLATCVTAYGGRVDKIVGDAMMALFGAPIAHEDDAQRAVRAALEMQRAFVRQRDAEPSMTDLSLRVGINSGEVLVGTPSSGEYTATGDVVNVASRLQTTAAPGQVIVGPATWAATRDAVRYVALGPVQAKGREELVDAWLAVEALAPPGYRPRRARAHLVGRDHELALVRNALATCTARQRAHLVLLLGEAGVGKSRLAEELARTARQDYGATVLEGRCVPYGEANSWWPVAEALRQACGITPSDTAEASASRCQSAVADATGLDVKSAEVVRITDGLLHLMGDEGRLAEVDPVRIGDEQRRSLELFLEALARARPLVVAVSELHWADDTVLDALDGLLDRLGSFAFLLIGTARPELEDRWQPRPGRHNTVLLTLDPLDEEASARLLASLFGVEPSDEVRALLLERSGGNPFFLEELTSLLGEAGVAPAEAGAGPARASASSAVANAGAATSESGPPVASEVLSELPATLRGLISARLDGLPSDERTVLEDAAVVGRSGPIDALGALAEAEGDGDISDALHRLVVKDLLLVDAGEFGFRSDLVREVAYETLTKAQRARRHSSLAEWLSERMRRLNREDEELTQVAYHLSAAGRVVIELGAVPDIPLDVAERAVDALQRAAMRAAQQNLHGEAIHLLDEAYSLTAGDVSRRRRVLLGRAKAGAASGELAAARCDLDVARASAEEAGDRVALARCLLVQGDIEQKEGHFAVAAATFGQAAAALNALGDDAGRADALRRAGMALLVGGDAEAAEAPIKEALAAARGLGLRRDEAWALQNLAWIAFTRNEPSLAEERLQESMLAFADVGDYGGLGWALGLLGWVRFQQGRLDEAAELVSQIVEEIDRKGDHWAHAMMVTLSALIRLWRGETLDAIAQAKVASAEFRALGDALGELRAKVPLVRGQIAAGRVREGLALLADLPEADTDGGGTGPIAALRLLLALNTANQLGDVGSARAALVGLTEELAASQRGFGELDTQLALLALQQRDATAAVTRLERVLARTPEGCFDGFGHSTLALAMAASGQFDQAIATATSVESAEAATYHDRAIAAVARGFAGARLARPSESQAAFLTAAATVDATGDVLAQALVRLAHARALAARGDPEAAAAETKARDRLRELDIEAAGWDAAFCLAAGPPVTARSSGPLEG
jgi:class 3 adenylate cyclase/predicted ATPase